MRIGYCIYNNRRSARPLLINDALSSHLGLVDPPVTPELVRKIVREELAAHG